MNWQIIVGAIFIIGSLGCLADGFMNFLLALLIGGSLMYWGLKKKGIIKPSKKESKSFVDAPRHSNLPKSVSLALDGYYLAYHYDDVKFYPPADIVSKINKKILSPGAEVLLKQEPQNKYDNHAVALYISGHKIGYLLKGTLQGMANDYIESGWPIKCILSRLSFSAGEYHGFVHLYFYRKSTKPKLKGYSDIDIHSIVPTNPGAIPNTPITKKNIVFSGLFSIPLEEIMQIAVDSGAVLKTRVSKSTHYLVIGTQKHEFQDENGLSSKEATATRLNNEGQANIKIISEQTFMELASIDLPE